MSTRTATRIHSVTNCRGETIEVDYIVTVIDEEHIHGVGRVACIRGAAGRPHFARVEWQRGEVEWSYLHVDELTNVNVNAKGRVVSE